MRAGTTLILVSMIFLLINCGSQDKAGKSEPVVQAPKVDLHSAVVASDLETIKQHIKAKSDLNVLEPSRASTPLITAAAVGNVEAAKLLISGGADLNYQNADGSTALHTATVFNRTDMSKVLIDSGIDLNLKNLNGSTALHLAAFFGRVDIAKMLLDKGADKTIKNNAGQTAAESVQVPFENVKGIYDAVGASLKPLGLILDYEQIKAARPKIAEMLK
ncbi:MAG: ankyrin repeat domain-containing protein [Calditrichaceae bacterium]|jgi:uncharacterized protein